MTFTLKDLGIRFLLISFTLVPATSLCMADDSAPRPAVQSPGFQSFLSGLFGPHDESPDPVSTDRPPAETDQSLVKADPRVDLGVAETPEHKAKSRLARGRVIDPAIRALVTQHASANLLPVGLAHAIVLIESRYNPRVRNRGAFGLMQIKLETARAVGFTGSDADLLDAETNLKFGMRYLAQVYKAAGGDICGTIMRYQSGHLSTRLTAANRAYCARAQQMMAGA